jgi:hypothetical protein
MNRAAFVSLLFASSAVAQVKPFQLGALREDVIKEFGLTERFFAPEPNKYLSGLIEYRAAVGVWARIDDVYMRETPTNAYEVHVMYHFDSRESRLRPKQRVGRVEFTVDKPKDFKETLAELPEAKSTCKGGCSLYGIVKYGSLEILAYPTNPEADLLLLGREVATGFRESDSQRTWGIGIRLKLDERPSSLQQGRPPNWKGKITDIELSAACLQCDLTPIASSSPRPVELGTWQPN